MNGADISVSRCTRASRSMPWAVGISKTLRPCLIGSADPDAEGARGGGGGSGNDSESSMSAGEDE
jgi:hypothetical protein